MLAISRGEKNVETGLTSGNAQKQDLFVLSFVGHSLTSRFVVAANCGKAVRKLLGILPVPGQKVQQLRQSAASACLV